MMVQGGAATGDRWEQTALQPGRLAMGPNQHPGCSQVDGLVQAERLYEATNHCGWVHQLVSLLTRHQQGLPVLGEMLGRQAIDRGLEEVPVERIVGTAQSSRSGEFDCQFCPLMPHLKQRWLSIAMRYHTGRSLPPVDLVLMDGCYFVVDGHHRVSVSRALGMDTIEAYVTQLV